MLTRARDVVVAIVGLVVFVITYPLFALAIKLDSRGPVIYTQTRVGLKGKRFTMYKYRSMSHEGHKPYETPKLEPVHFKTFVFTTPTSRLTRVGRFLRSTSLDELPNFWNVLRGEMTLVGPRPEIPELVEQYPDGVPPASRREAGDHGAGAGQRPRGPDVRRHDAVRHRVREHALVRGGSEDPVADADGGGVTPGSAVAGTSMSGLEVGSTIQTRSAGMAAPSRLRQRTMPLYRSDFPVATTADRVWAVLTDFACYPEWNPQITRISGPVELDGAVQMTLTLPGRPGLNLTARLSAVEPPTLLKWNGHVIAPWFFRGERSSPSGHRSRAASSSRTVKMCAD